MRSIVCTVLILLAVCAQAQDTVSNKLFRYTGPAGYNRHASKAPISALLIGPTYKKYASNIGFLWADDQGKTVETWLEEVRQQRGMEKGTTITQPKPTTLGGRPAQYIVITTGADSSNQLIVACVAKGKMVAVLLTTQQGIFQKQLKTFQASLKSFKWLN